MFGGSLFLRNLHFHGWVEGWDVGWWVSRGPRWDYCANLVYWELWISLWCRSPDVGWSGLVSDVLLDYIGNFALNAIFASSSVDGLVKCDRQQLFLQDENDSSIYNESRICLLEDTSFSRICLRVPRTAPQRGHKCNPSYTADNSCTHPHQIKQPHPHDKQAQESAPSGIFKPISSNCLPPISPHHRPTYEYPPPLIDLLTSSSPPPPSRHVRSPAKPRPTDNSEPPIPYRPRH